jgi:glycosyltransferase involved in cell wall biosynthesis
VKVANIIEEGKLGGPQVRIVNVAAELSDTAPTTVIFPNENSENFKSKCEAVKIPFITLNLSRITTEWKVALRYVFFSAYEVFKLVRIIKKENFDIIHVSGGSWQFKGVLAGRLARKRVLWHLNDTYVPTFIRIFFSVFSRFADGFIFASERTRDYYIDLIPNDKKGYLIPAPVNTKNFCHELIEKHSIPDCDGKIVVGMVANVNRIKGIDVFVRCAAEVNKITDNIQFVVVGPVYDNQKKYYQSLLELCRDLSVENISFVGGQSDIRPFVNRFDIYLCTSLAESSPISVWEAMSLSKPIISTDVGDVPLYVQPEKNGYITDVGDFKCLAEHVVSLAKDSKKRELFGAESRRIAEKKLDISICAKKHLSAYQDILCHISD